MNNGAMMEMVMMIVVMPVFVIASAWVIRGMGRFYLSRQAMNIQADFQNKLLDKFGTAPELLDYLQSDVGTKSIQVPAMSEAKMSPFSRILGAAQTGIVLACLGVAFLLLRGLVPDANEGFAIVGALGLALGLGFLASGAVAFTLSKSWGLINGSKDSDASDV